MSNPFDVKAYYSQIINQDIGEITRQLIPDRITDQQNSTITIDCPHHASQSKRSMHIWTDKQGWFCHGCGKGGDVLQLVEFIQSGDITTGQSGKMSLTHRKARDWLASKLNLPPLNQLNLSPEEIKKLEEEKTLTLRAEEVLTAITEFYTNQLLKDTKQLDWLSKQYNFNLETIKKYKIGYTNNNGLIDYLLKLGFTLRDMTASGAFRPSSQNDEVVFPTFENRIIFPYISKGRTVFMIARKTPQTPDNDFEKGKYKKLPIHDHQKRPYIATGITNNTLYNEDILTAEEDYIIITEGITDCISLINYGFPAISPVTIHINANDWERIIPKLKRVKKVILCQDNEVSEAGWNGALRSAEKLSKNNITCLVAKIPLGIVQQTTRDTLQNKYQISSGITPKELKHIKEEKSDKICNEIQDLLERSKIDVCSFFVGGKTADDFKTIIDSALLPIDYAIQETPNNPSEETIDKLLVEIGKQSRTESSRLIKKLQPKTQLNLTELRNAVKDATKANNHKQYEILKTETQRKLGQPVLQRGNRTFYLIDNSILEQTVKETPNGPCVESKELANFHIKIDREEVSDDGEFHDNGSTVVQKLLSGNLIGIDWEINFKVKAEEWGNNNKLSCKISEQSGTKTLFSTKDIDMIRMFCASNSGHPPTKTIYSVFGTHPTAGFVTPSLIIKDGIITKTIDSDIEINVGRDYAKAQRLDLCIAEPEEVKSVVQHLLSDYLDLQPREVTMPLLAHAFIGPLLFGFNLEGEFPPFTLFLVGSSGKGKTEVAKLAQSIWGNFLIKEHLASWSSTPLINQQEAAKCRGALWTIDDFKKSKIGKSQWGNAIRILLDYADLQARKRATPGAKVITNNPIKGMLLVTGEDMPSSETALQARSLIIEFNGHKDIKLYRKCIEQQNDYRKVPAYYIAWLQQQDRNTWLTKVRKTMDTFTTFIDNLNLDTDNSRRIASNATLSLSGFQAFLEFAVSIDAIDLAYANSLKQSYVNILENILERMLVEVEDIKPINLFWTTINEQLKVGKITIKPNASAAIASGTRVIGFYKDNNEFICLFPGETMSVVREAFFRGHGEDFPFTNNAIGRQLLDEGYMKKPSNGRHLAKLSRIKNGPTKESKVTRTWNILSEKVSFL